MQSTAKDTDLMQDTKLFFDILRMLISFLSRPCEAFIRYRFGERYFSPFPVIVTAIIINLFVIFQTATNPITGEPVTPLGVMIFSALFVAASIYHRLVITTGNYKGSYEVYSYSSGNSWNIWYRIFKHDSFLNRLFPFFVNRVAEPVFVWVVGIGFYMIDPLVGGFIQISAVALLAQEAITYRYRRMEYLDMKDAKLAAQYNSNMEKMFNQKPKASGKNSSITPHEVSPA